jgi:Bacteriophage head to tail connecting protein
LTGKVLELQNIISPDLLAVRLTERWVQWDTLRNNKKADWEEIRRYVYATDTSQTTNNQLPWKNKTTVPKLCQIADNLYANYTATMFPPSGKNIIWEANEKDSAQVAKRNAIENYMTWVTAQPYFKHEMDKLILDYIHFGNAIGTVEWIDKRVLLPDGRTQVGYIGPAPRRISPLDIVMNPTSENFESSPKLIRSIISLGELRSYLEQITTDDNRDTMENLYEYLQNIRFHARTFQGDWIQRDHLYQMDGFTSFRAYLLSEFVEILTFYGDWYDFYTDHFEKNRVITVIDRHRLINNKPNPSYFGYPPIFHSPWRKKVDNLWGMGPLDNLIGMQYRLDHLENMRADGIDLTTYPVQLVKGFVEDFTWQPGEKIFTGEEGSVELVQPNFSIMAVDLEIQQLKDDMEVMAGAPKEAMGFRSPGEKTKYEVQSLENAAARIFANKIKQFEEQVVEPILNAMLELARRNMVGATTIQIFDDEFKAQAFQEITAEDITGIGRIRPVAARHYAEDAQLIQNLTNLAQSNIWPMVQPHFSGVSTAKMLERKFNLEQYSIVTPYIALVEQADAQKQAQVLEEQIHAQTMTASGIGGDYDMQPAGNQFNPNQPQQGGPPV